MTIFISDIADNANKSNADLNIIIPEIKSLGAVDILEIDISKIIP